MDIVELMRDFWSEGAMKTSEVPYREGIRRAAAAEGKHKKLVGGVGQFGVVSIRFEPQMYAEDFEFANRCIGGVMPKEYVPAVEKGLREAMRHGVLGGFPVIGVKATLFDGKYHPVDSKEVAFKSAAKLAFNAACVEADPVILEPIGRVEVLVPDEYVGDVIGDLTCRRGRILGMNPVDGLQQVVAEVPISEITVYGMDLCFMTENEGSFSVEFERYEELPSRLEDKVIEQARKNATD